MGDLFFGPTGDAAATMVDVGADILSTHIDEATGTIRISVGNSTRPYQEATDCLYVTPFGWMGRPPAMTRGDHSAQAARWCTGIEDVVFGGYDRKSQAVYGQLEEGESAGYATAPGAWGRILLKADGTARLGSRTAKDATEEFLDLTADGQLNIEVSQSFTVRVGAVTITVNADGSVEIDCASMVIKAPITKIGPSPEALVPAVNSALRGPTGIIGQPSPAVLIG